MGGANGFSVPRSCARNLRKTALGLGRTCEISCLLNLEERSKNLRRLGTRISFGYGRRDRADVMIVLVQ